MSQRCVRQAGRKSPVSSHPQGMPMPAVQSVSSWLPASSHRISLLHILWGIPQVVRGSLGYAMQTSPQCSHTMLKTVGWGKKGKWELQSPLAASSVDR